MDYTRIESQIDAVTVYREGALVRRVAELTRGQTAYPDFVCISGLPLALKDGSVRVRVEAVGEGGEGGTGLPVAADVRVTLDVPARDSDARPPVDEELEAARAELRRLAGELAQVKRELARVERLNLAGRPSSKGEVIAPPPSSPVQARLALLELRERHERGLRDELAQLTRTMYRAELRMQELQARHQRATSARQAHEHELRKAVVIALHEEGDAPAPAARLVLEYQVPGARWAPAYTIRMAADGDASFAMRAVVAQNTGEDWRGVALTLSTADAHQWTELPELASIRIGRQQARPARAGWRPPPSGVEALFADYDRDMRSARKAALGQELAQWDDQTREITAPARRAASQQVHASSVSDFDYLEEAEEATVPHLRPPPAPPSMPMPSAPPISGMAPPMMGGAPPAPAMAPQAPMAKKQARRDRKAREQAKPEATARMSLSAGPARSGAPGSAPYEGFAQLDEPFDMAPEPAPAQLVASADLLAYGELRMPSPRAAERGSLQKVGRREVYTELLIEQRVEVSFNVLAVIGVAFQRARAVAAQPLPPRHRAAGSDRYDYAYATETPADVPSDGAFHSIALAEKQANTRLRYVVVPRESTDVFRTAELANPLRAPILDGPVDVYLGEDFLLTSELLFTPPGGTVRMGLGVEQAIKVTRNTGYREETSGLLRGSLMLVHTIDIEVQNHLERAVECEVRERVPSVRKDEDDIEVTVEEVKPPWQEYKPESAASPESGLKGGYAWRVEVPGKGGRKPLTVKYAVKIPSKYELVGGNRREA